MRFHPLALSIAVGALASSDAFVLPKPTSTGATTRTAATSNGDSQYSLDVNGSDKSKKPTSRIEKQRAQLQADVDAAEELKSRTAQQLADADMSRLALEIEAEKAAKEAEAIEAKFNAFEAKQAARVAAGGSLGAVGGVVGPVVGGGAIIGGLVVGREQLVARSEKAEEERLQREEAERQAEEAVRRRAAQESQSKNLLPIVGAGVAGLGAFGALLNSQGGDSTVIDAVSKVPQDKVGPQKNAGSATTSVPEPPPVALPYLDKKIAKAEIKQSPDNPWARKQLQMKATEEQKAMEARLEKKLAQAPDLTQQTAAKNSEEEVTAAAEKAKAEKIAADKLAFEKLKTEQAAAEKKAAEEAAAAAEKAKADKFAADQLAFDKLKAEQAAKAEKLAAEQKAKREKMEADKVAFEKMKAEQEELQAREKEAAAALEQLKQQDAKWKGIVPKVPAVSEMLFGDNKPSNIVNKGLSSIFNPNVAIVGGVALVGTAIAAAVAAASEPPSVKSTFKVTGKTPQEYLQSRDASSAGNGASSKKNTIRIPKPTKQGDVNKAPPKEMESMMSEKSSDDELEKDNLMQQVKDAGVAGVISYAGWELAFWTVSVPVCIVAYKQVTGHWPDFKDKDDLSKLGAEAFAFVNFARFAVPLRIGLALGTTPWVQENIVDVFLSDKEKESDNEKQIVKPVAAETVTIETVADKPLPDTPKVAPKKAPTQKVAPAPGSKEALREELKRQRNNLNKQVEAKEASEEPIVEDTAPPSPEIETTFSDASNVENTVVNAVPAFTPPAKKSYSPFGGGKTWAVANDPLYAPPAPQPLDQLNPPASESFASDQNMNENASFATVPKKSYSPFGGGKTWAVANDPLYAPPPPQSLDQLIPPTSEYFASDQNMNENASFATMPKKSYSPFGGAKTWNVSNDSLYAPPSTSTMTDSSEIEASNQPVVQPVVQPAEPTFNQNAFGATPPTSYPKSSYSPFGTGKPKAAGNDTLYAPLTSFNTPESSFPTNPQVTMDSYDSFEETSPHAFVSDASDFVSPPPSEPSVPSPEISSYTQTASPPPSKSSYSPFGNGKTFAVTNNSLYSPPTTSNGSSYDAGYSAPESEPIIEEPYGSAPVEESSLPFAASGLNDAPGVSGPETTAFRASSPKKSFSPFGTKPRAPDAGSGYLNDL